MNIKIKLINLLPIIFSLSRLVPDAVKNVTSDYTVTKIMTDYIKTGNDQRVSS